MQRYNNLKMSTLSSMMYNRFKLPQCYSQWLCWRRRYSLVIIQAVVLVHWQAKPHQGALEHYFGVQYFSRAVFC